MHRTHDRNVTAHSRWMALFLLSVSPLFAEIIRIDGDFKDWQEVEMLASDPGGDAQGAFDVTRVYAASQGSILYLRFDTGRILNIQNGPESEGTLGLMIGLPDDRQLKLDMRGRRAHLSEDPDEGIPWRDLKYSVGPTHAQDEFELQVDLHQFGVEMGDSVSIQFSGSDQLDAPVRITLSQPRGELTHRSSLRLPGTDIRIVSFNTYVDGLSDPNRAEVMERLLKAVDGDVYCFQEEWESSDIDRIMKRLGLLHRVGLTAIHQVHGNMIASRYPLKALPSANGNYALARIDVGGNSLFVMSVHLSAMGYIGSKEDLRRIQQAAALLDTVTEINRGTYDARDGERRGSGIVMVGDFNLVGSRTPVDLLATEAISGLENWTLPHLAGDSVVTWRGGVWSSFSPGKLDYSLHSSATLIRKNGFVLNSELLSQTELDKLKLERTDSHASDHLLMVTDYQFGDVPVNQAEAR